MKSYQGDILQLKNQIRAMAFEIWGLTEENTELKKELLMIKEKDNLPKQVPDPTLEFFAVGNDELGDPIDKFEICPNCRKKHRVEHLGGLEGVSAVKCGTDRYLVGVKRRKIKTR